jgi:hypothetical protein
MGETVEYGIRIVLIGIGATMVMDAWLLVLRRAGVPTLNFALLGRWAGHVVRGRWFHDGIARSAPIEHELLLGWSVHYATGVVFAALAASLLGMEWVRQPALLPAVAIGLATVIAPLFVMQPAMGAGVASSRTPAPLRNCLKGAANHLAFGGGLYLAAAALAR